MMIDIPVICSWCGTKIAVLEVLEEALPDTVELKSDGVCDDCSAQLMEDVEALKKER